MGGNASDTLGHLAGYGVGALSALTSIKGGGLQNWLLNRQRAVEDPAIRASLVGSPFASGMLLQSGGDVAAPGTMPAAGSVAAPDDIRWLQQQNPTRHFLPALPPLPAEQQVQTQAAQGIISGTQSADPVIRANAKLAGKIPLTPDEQVAGLGWGRRLQLGAGPGGTVGVEVPGMPITIGSPYIGGQYLDYDSAVARAKVTGGQVAPAPGGGFEVVQPQQAVQGSYPSKAAAEAAITKPGIQEAVPSGQTINGVPQWMLRDKPPTGVEPLENRPPAQGAKPAAKPVATPATPPASTAAPPPARQAAPAPAAAPAPEGAAAPSPAPAPEGAAPQPPQPPPTPPHSVVILRPDGTFAPAPKPQPAPAPRPRAEAAPTVAPPMLAAGAPPLFQFPGAATPAPGAAPVMVASAAPPPTYQVVPGSELGGVASGAPPAPAEERAPPPPPERPAPVAAVPFPQVTPGQAPEAAPAAAPGQMPAGTQRVTETRPIAGAAGGTVSYEETTPAGLDFEKKREIMQKDIEYRYGKIANAKDLAGMAVVRGTINDLLTAYTPEQRAQYLGYAVTPIKSLEKFLGGRDPDYENFLQMNANIRDAAIAAGLSERAVANFPTGYEHTADTYESQLRGSVNMIDKMIAAPGAYQAMHPEEMTPANQQKVIDQYLSGPVPVHFGPYPWDEKTGRVIPTETTTTTTSPGPTTTTLYPVDVRHTVAPSQ